MSGRRTTLVWRRRRFWCGNCEERHLEEHAQFQGGWTRRFARRLVEDARVISIRAVARHHRVGWHRIMRLVKAHSERVAERRRARRCRVLLVDETSIRRRHRYVTVVAWGESGKVLAMIPGRSKGSLTRFFRAQGADWRQGVEIVVSDGSRSYQAAIARYLSTLAMSWTGSTLSAGSPKGSPWHDENSNAATRTRHPQRSSRTCSEPGSLSYAGSIISPTTTKPTWSGCSRLIHG